MLRRLGLEQRKGREIESHSLISRCRTTPDHAYKKWLEDPWDGVKARVLEIVSLVLKMVKRSRTKTSE